MVHLSKPPVWALILIILAASSAVLLYVSFALVGVPFLGLNYQPPGSDFTMVASPTSQAVTPGSSIVYVNVTSIKGFAGTVNLATSVSPGGTNSPSVVLHSANVIVPANIYHVMWLDINTANVVGTHPLVFNITVVGHAGSLSHTLYLTIAVLPPGRCWPGYVCPQTPDPQTFRPTDPLGIVAGQDPNTLQVTNIRITNFGTYNLSLYTYSYNPTTVDYTIGRVLRPGDNLLFAPTQPGVKVSAITVLWQAPPPPPTYTSHVQLNQSWAAIGGPAPELLQLYSGYINSSTTAILLLRNFGVTNVTLTGYYVTDANGDKYALNNWAGPTISPTDSTGVTMTLSIGASCASCTLTGNPFTFITGYTYTFVVVTSHNQQSNWQMTY